MLIRVAFLVILAAVIGRSAYSAFHLDNLDFSKLAPVEVDPRLCKYCAELATVESRTDLDSRRRTHYLKVERARADQGLRAFHDLGGDPHIVDCPGCEKAGYGRPER
jgi:hypothetical protein